MAGPFDREAIARVFDEYADAEWSRHETSPFARVSFHVHRHYLGRFLRPGDRVLEVGAGAGRFTVELVRLGARVTVVDERHPCDLVVASVANFLSIGNDETCERWIRDDPAMWERFLAWEVASCAEPGAIDGGTHIIAVVETR